MGITNAICTHLLIISIFQYGNVRHKDQEKNGQKLDNVSILKLIYFENLEEK